MSHGRSTTYARRPVDEASQYIERVSRHAKQVLRQSRYWYIQPQDGLDIASRIVVRVWANLDDYRRRYASPEALAASMVGYMIIDFYRNDGAQRGDGSRFQRLMGPLDLMTRALPPLGAISRTSVDDPFPQLRSLRVYDQTKTTSLTATEPPDVDRMLDRLEAEETCARMHAALLGNGAQRRGLWLMQQVDGEGRTVVEVARELGISRETAQRELGRVRVAARAVVEQWRVDTAPDAA